MSPTKTKAKAEAVGTLDIAIKSVTPAQAQLWLEDNEVNRNLRSKVVNAYRRDMEAGRWMFTGEPIQLSRTGRLLNGQHRLTALASANVEHIDFVVATGLPDEAQAMMDQGAPRSISDALRIQGQPVKNLTVVASVARWLVLSPEIGPHLTPTLLRNKVTTAEALAVFDNYPGISEAAERAIALRNVLLGSPSAVAYTWVHMARVDASACKEFFAGIADMEWSFQHDPRKAALRRMQAIHRDQEIKTTLETGVYMVSVLSRAWNAWRREEPMDTINIRSRSGLIPPVVLI